MSLQIKLYAQKDPTAAESSASQPAADAVSNDASAVPSPTPVSQDGGVSPEANQ